MKWQSLITKGEGQVFQRFSTVLDWLSRYGFYYSKNEPDKVERDAISWRSMRVQSFVYGTGALRYGWKGKKVARKILFVVL